MFVVSKGPSLNEVFHSLSGSTTRSIDSHLSTPHFIRTLTSVVGLCRTPTRTTYNRWNGTPMQHTQITDRKGRDDVIRNNRRHCECVIRDTHFGGFTERLFSSVSNSSLRLVGRGRTGDDVGLHKCEWYFPCSRKTRSPPLILAACPKVNSVGCYEINLPVVHGVVP